MLVLGSFAGNVGLFCGKCRLLLQRRTYHRVQWNTAYMLWDNMYVSVGLFCGKCRLLLQRRIYHCVQWNTAYMLWVSKETCEHVHARIGLLCGKLKVFLEGEKIFCAGE